MHVASPVHRGLLRQAVAFSSPMCTASSLTELLASYRMPGSVLPSERRAFISILSLEYVGLFSDKCVFTKFQHKNHYG